MLKYIAALILLLPAIILADDEPDEDTVGIIKDIQQAVSNVTDIKMRSIFLGRDIASAAYNSIPKIEYSSVVEFNKVFYNGCVEPSITQVIFWERRQKTVDVDLVFSILNYVNYTKVGILDYYVVKDWRMLASLSDIDINEIGEGQYSIEFTDGLANRKIYCGEIVFTQTRYDPERLNIKVLALEKRVLLAP